ncbi:hypothetical protein ACFLTU_02790 [Bacteroidota bacterium]
MKGLRYIPYIFIVLLSISCTEYSEYEITRSPMLPEYVSEYIYYDNNNMPYYRYIRTSFDEFSYNYVRMDYVQEDNVWIVSSRQSELFDEYGNSIFHSYTYTYNPQMTNFSYQVSYEVFEIDERTSEFHIYNWQEYEWRWIKIQIIRINYNDNKLIDTHTEYSVDYYDEYNQEIKENRLYSFTYYGDGTVKSKTEQRWNNNWENYLREEFEYNGEGYLTSNSRFIYSDGEWLKNRKYEYYYYSGNKRQQYISFVKHDSLNEWVNNSKTDYTYHPDDREKLLSGYSWNTSENKWMNSTKTEFSYDHPVYPRITTAYAWDENISDWIINSKSEYEKYTEEHIIAIYYDYINGSYIFNSKTENIIHFRKGN